MREVACCGNRPLYSYGDSAGITPASHFNPVFDAGTKFSANVAFQSGIKKELFSQVIFIDGGLRTGCTCGPGNKKTILLYCSMINETSTNISIAAKDETGRLNIFLLKRCWSIVLAKRRGQVEQTAYSAEFAEQVTMLNVLGIGIEQFYRELLLDDISFEAFEEKIIALNGLPDPEKIIEFNNRMLGRKPATVEVFEPEPVLSGEDLECWHKNGYVIIHDAMPAADIRNAADAVWEFLGMDKNDSSTWYHEHPARQGIMIQLFQHPALEANRQSEKIRRAYEQIWGTRDLWVSTDRVSFNPPETVKWPFQGPRLHFDVSLEMPMPFGLQGLLYLTDTEANQGAFTLVPGFHNKIEEWINQLPPGADPRKEDLYALGPVPIAGKAGDFILWHQALPHGSSPNTHTQPRIVQYINWMPVNPEVKSTWI